MSRAVESWTAVVVWLVAAGVLAAAGGSAVLLAPVAAAVAVCRAQRDGLHLPLLHAVTPEARLRG